VEFSCGEETSKSKKDDHSLIGRIRKGKGLSMEKWLLLIRNGDQLHTKAHKKNLPAEEKHRPVVKKSPSSKRRGLIPHFARVLLLESHGGHVFPETWPSKKAEIFPFGKSGMLIFTNTKENLERKAFILKKKGTGCRVHLGFRSLLRCLNSALV